MGKHVLAGQNTQHISLFNENEKKIKAEKFLLFLYTMGKIILLLAFVTYFSILNHSLWGFLSTKILIFCHCLHFCRQSLIINVEAVVHYIFSPLMLFWTSFLYFSPYKLDYTDNFRCQVEESNFFHIHNYFYLLVVRIWKILLVNKIS